MHFSVQHPFFKNPILAILGMLFGLVFLKKLFKLRDTTIITISILSMGLCCLIIGLAVTSWQIYVSLVPDSLHGLLNPLTYTFITCLVEPNEVKAAEKGLKFSIKG